MIAFFIILAMLAAVFLFGIGFLLWVIHEHLHAHKWRTLVKIAKEQNLTGPTQQGWTVTYKLNRKTETYFATGAADEADALKIAIKAGIPVEGIISVTKG